MPKAKRVADLKIRGLPPGVVEWLRARARRESVSPEEIAQRVLPAAFADEKGMGTAIREIVGDGGVDLEIPPREVEDPIDFSGPEYGPYDDDRSDEAPGPAGSRAPSPTATETDTPPA